jgi:hypothetical protein
VQNEVGRGENIPECVLGVDVQGGGAVVLVCTAVPGDRAGVLVAAPV